MQQTFKNFIQQFILKILMQAKKELLHVSDMSEQIKRLQDQALKRARNLGRRPKSSFKKLKQKHHVYKNRSLQKLITAEQNKRYSIEKVHERNQIEFVSQIIKSKQLTKKINAKLKLQKYSFQHIIGCGMFGKVWRVQDRSTHKLYAIKQIQKSLVITRKGIGTVMNQRQIVTQLHHNLIPPLISAFQTELNLFLVLPLMEKGDLRYHITKFKQFEEKQVRFFAACVVSVLEYLRKCGVIHRDVKPENLLIDQAGYLYLSDFGIAQRADQVAAGNCCGTPAYMAPEVIFQKQYSYAADYYALGVVLYQMMMGQRPYIGSNKQQLKTLISKHSASIKKSLIPEGWSIESADLVNKLLHRNPSHRLGFNSISEIKNHPWLKNFPWERLDKKQLISPYCQCFNHWEVDYKQLYNVKNKQQISGIENSLLSGDIQEVFHHFTYQGYQKSTEYTTKPSIQMKFFH